MASIDQLRSLYEVDLALEATGANDELGHPGTPAIYRVVGDDFSIQVAEDDSETIRDLLDLEQRRADQETVE